MHQTKQHTESICGAAWQTIKICELQTFHFCTLAGSNSLVDPVAQVGHAGIHSRSAHVAVRGTPGNNTHKGPHSTALTDQRATRVTLQRDKYETEFRSMHWWYGTEYNVQCRMWPTTGLKLIHKQERTCSNMIILHLGSLSSVTLHVQITFDLKLWRRKNCFVWFLLDLCVFALSTINSLQ